MFNNALLMAAASAGADLVSVGNSALFVPESQNLQRTQTAGSNTVWTFSSWIYKCETKNQVFLNFGTGGANGQLGWNASDQLYIYNGATVVGLTSSVYRDIGWYHIHLAYNTGESGTDKVKLSINGSLVTTWGTDNRSSAGAFEDANQNTQITYLGNNSDTSGTSFSGYMAETVMLDGTASAVGNFGEFDSTGLYWTPLASATIQELTFGTNGYYLANLVTDAPQLDFQAGDDNTVADSQISALLHMDGSNDATSATDSSSYGNALTFVGNAHLDTGVKKFGTASLQLDGNGDYVTMADSDVLNWGTGDFTVSFSIYFTTIHTPAASYTNVMIAKLNSGGGDFLISYKNGTNLYVLCNTTVIDQAYTLSTGQWYQMEISRSGTSVKWFIDGTERGSGTSSFDNDNTDVMAIGASNYAGWRASDRDIAGYMDEIQIIKGAALHTSNFTAPSAAYSNPPTANSFTNTGSVATTALMTPTKLSRLLWNPLSPLCIANLTEGNTKTASTSGGHEGAWANTNFPKTGKWQTEVLVDVSGGAGAVVSFAIMKNLSAESLNQYIGTNSQAYGFYVYPTNQSFYSATSALFTTGTVARSTFKYQICWDASAEDGTADVYFGIDNTFYDNDGSTDGNPATGANPTIENLDISTSEWSLLGVPYNVGTLTTADEADWEFAIQTGFTSLDDPNLIETTTRTVSDPYEHWFNDIYTGTGLSNKRTTDFQVDFSWTKTRGISSSHAIFDVVRGTENWLRPDSTAADTTNANGVDSFDSDGITFGPDTSSITNTSGNTMVGWFAKLGGAPTATNSAGAGATPTAGSVKIDGVNLGSALAGTIAATKITANTTLGMSCGTYTGTGSANETIATGLTGCEMIIVKRTDTTYSWAVWQSGLTDDYSLLLNTTAAQVNSGYWDTSGNTSSVIELGTDSEAVNKSGQPYYFMAFAPSQFISLGSYEGNNNANGAFVPMLNSAGVPIRPIWALYKTIDTTSVQWILMDDARAPYNEATGVLYADATSAENTTASVSRQDWVNGGVKFRTSYNFVNGVNSYLYLTIGIPIIDVDGRILAGR